MVKKEEIRLVSSSKLLVSSFSDEKQIEISR